MEVALYRAILTSVPQIEAALYKTVLITVPQTEVAFFRAALITVPQTEIAVYRVVSTDYISQDGGTFIQGRVDRRSIRRQLYTGQY